MELDMDSRVNMEIPVEILKLSDVIITESYLRNDKEIIIKVESTKKEIPCRECGEACEAHGYDRPMELRHLPILGYKTYIQLTPKRGTCKKCNDKPTTTTQTLDWYERKARQTKPYELSLLCEMINSTFEDVSRKQDIDCQTLQLIIDRYVDTEVDFSAIKYLGLLGIDEISLRKGRQKYVTVFTYRHDGKVRVLKIIDGRKMEEVEAFLKSIPENLKQTVTTVCSDLYDGSINPAKAVFGKTRITADRFHVSKLYRKKLIIVRKSELKRLQKILTEEEYKALKSATSILRKGKDYFTDDERKILDPLFELSPKLHLAYTFSHQLTTIYNSKIKKKKAVVMLKSWVENVNNSKLNAFNSFIDTLNKHMNEISNYFKERNSSGFVEGFNNRIKVLTRRCYGLGNAKRLFQRIKLDTEGLNLFKFSGAYC